MNRQSMKPTQTNQQRPEEPPSLHIGSLDVGPIAYRIETKQGEDIHMPLELIKHHEDFRQIKKALDNCGLELKLEAMTLELKKLDKMIAKKPWVLDLAAHSGTKESERSKVLNLGSKRHNMKLNQIPEASVAFELPNGEADDISAAKIVKSFERHKHFFKLVILKICDSETLG